MAPWLYLPLLGLSCLYAFWRGAAPERMAAAILLLSVAGSAITLTLSAHRYAGTEVADMWVDIVSFVGFMLLALAANRFWPIWLAAVQLDIIATHLIMFSPRQGALSYWAMNALWSYPLPLLIAIGALRHRARLKRFGSDRSWSAALLKGF